VTQSTLALLTAGLGLGAGTLARAAAGSPGIERPYYETPHYDIVRVHFIERRIEVSFQNSLTRMSTVLHAETRPGLKGIASV
jgi:hypothetical protein